MQPYEELEVEWGKFINSPNCVACSSGTAALHLSLETLRRPCWTKQSRCLVPEFTMVACARAVVLADMVPEFIDCDDRLLMDFKGVPTWNVRALMPVHIYGRQCNIDPLIAFSKQNDCVVIEDMSEIHGVKPHSETDAACWSFYRNKIIHGEEGGIIAFKKKEHADKAKQLRSLGFTEQHDFNHIPRGHNYRLSNVHAELILDSLEVYPFRAAKRRQLEDCYNDLIPQEYQQPKRDAVWVYDVRVPGLTKYRQDLIVQTLNAQGIAVRHGFKPMSTQSEFYNEVWRLDGCKNALKASQEVIYFPVSPEMTRADVEHSVNVFLDLLAH